MGRRGLAAALVVGLLTAGSLPADVVARCGKGYLERVDGHLVLHVKGTPYEMGYQHGALLKQHALDLMHYLFEVKGNEKKIEFLGMKLTPKEVVKAINGYQKQYIPRRFLEEMEGIADAIGVAADEVFAANGIPELFHCSGFALLNELTADGTLLHGRVLDYAVDWRLQEHAVLIVAEPDGRIPFANVSYAGFVGSVTGMNRQQVSIGEMGGAGLGKWSGAPMAFLMRRTLEEARTLDDAIAIFRDSPRTCEYFYVLADAKSNRAVGMEASADRFVLIKPGAADPRLPTPIPNTVLMSAGKRYTCLCEMVKKVDAAKQKFTVEQAIRLMEAPVAMKSNLHNVLMAPGKGKLWVAHASADKKPAWQQRYHAFDFAALLQQECPTGAKELPAPPARRPVQAARR